MLLKLIDQAPDGNQRRNLLIAGKMLCSNHRTTRTQMVSKGNLDPVYTVTLGNLRNAVFGDCDGDRMSFLLPDDVGFLDPLMPKQRFCRCL